MPQTTLSNDIFGFLRQIAAKVVSPQIFTELCQELEDAKNSVWTPTDRLGSTGMQLLPAKYTTTTSEEGVGYYFEVEFQLTDPEEKHMFTWMLPVDPQTDAIVGHLKSSALATWSHFAATNEEQKPN